MISAPVSFEWIQVPQVHQRHDKSLFIDKRQKASSGFGCGLGLFKVMSLRMKYIFWKTLEVYGDSRERSGGYKGKSLIKWKDNEWLRRLAPLWDLL